MMISSKDMDKPFNLTRCDAKSLRRRTLSGQTVWYHTYFQPKGLDKHQRRSAIDRFKHPKTKEDEVISSNMISESVWKFIQENDINNFDVIVGVPSSSDVVSRIIKKMVQDCDFKGQVIYKGFKKTRVRNVKLKQDVLDRESSLKTKEKVPNAFVRTRKLHYDKVSKVSLFPTRFRRYFENFLKLNIPHSSCVLNKNVLVIDDTFGEGLTMCEAFRTLNPLAKNVIGFTVMKDIAS